MGEPLSVRREALAELMKDAPTPLRYSETLAGTPDVLVPVLREQA